MILIIALLVILVNVVPYTEPTKNISVNVSHSLKNATVFLKFLTGYRWVRNSSLNDSLHSDMSSIQCAVACKCTSSCQTFLFDISKFQCLLMSDDPKDANITEFVQQDGIIIYKHYLDMQNEGDGSNSLITFTTQSETSTTYATYTETDVTPVRLSSTPLQASNSCLSNPCRQCKSCSCIDIQEYQTVRNYLCLQCGSSKTTYSKAATTCPKSDSTMHLIFYNKTSEWKMDAIKDFIKQCSNTSYYWIDNSLVQNKVSSDEEETSEEESSSEENDRKATTTNNCQSLNVQEGSNYGEIELISCDVSTAYICEKD